MFRPPRPRIRHLLFATPLAAALLVQPATPARADGPQADLDCTITESGDIQPGLTSQRRHFVEHTHGPTGTATCAGTVDGQQVTGPGTFGLNGRAVGDCTGGSGGGSFVLRIPTTGGTKTVTGKFNDSYSDLSSANGSPHVTGDLTGSSTILSAEGDCFTTPVTHYTETLTAQVTT
jgi:hypothetical protein